MPAKSQGEMTSHVTLVRAKRGGCTDEGYRGTFLRRQLVSEEPLLLPSKRSDEPRRCRRGMVHGVQCFTHTGCQWTTCRIKLGWSYHRLVFTYSESQSHLVYFHLSTEHEFSKHIASAYSSQMLLRPGNKETNRTVLVVKRKQNQKHPTV